MLTSALRIDAIARAADQTDVAPSKGNVEPNGKGKAAHAGDAEGGGGGGNAESIGESANPNPNASASASASAGAGAGQEFGNAVGVAGASAGETPKEAVATLPVQNTTAAAPQPMTTAAPAAPASSAASVAAAAVAAVAAVAETSTAAPTNAATSSTGSAQLTARHPPSSSQQQQQQQQIADSKSNLAEMEKMRQQLNRAQSRLKSMETRNQEVTKEKDELRTTLVASLNRSVATCPCTTHWSALALSEPIPKNVDDIAHISCSYFNTPGYLFFSSPNRLSRSSVLRFATAGCSESTAIQTRIPLVRQPAHCSNRIPCTLTSLLLLAFALRLHPCPSSFAHTCTSPPDAGMVQQMADLTKKVETLTSTVVFKEQELQETDTKRAKVQKRLDLAEKELAHAKGDARTTAAAAAAAAKGKRAASASLDRHSTTAHDGIAGSASNGSGASTNYYTADGPSNSSSPGTGSSVSVVQAVFHSIAAALTHSTPASSVRGGCGGGSAIANTAVHTTVAIQSLLESAGSSSSGLSILPLLLDTLEPQEKTMDREMHSAVDVRRGGKAAAAGGDNDADAAGVLPASITPAVVSALYTTRELITSSYSFRAAMLHPSVAAHGHASDADNDSAGTTTAAADISGGSGGGGGGAADTAGNGGGGAAAPPAMLEVDDWSPHAHAADVVAAVAGDAVRLWAALYQSLGRAARAGAVANAAAASSASASTAHGSVAAGNSGAGNGGGGGGGGGGAAGRSAPMSTGGGSTDAAADGVRAWAAVCHILSSLRALAVDCPQHGHDLFNPLFGASNALTLCVESGQ